MVLFFLVEMVGFEPTSCSHSTNVYPTRLVYSVKDLPIRINKISEVCDGSFTMYRLHGFDLSI